MRAAKTTLRRDPGVLLSVFVGRPENYTVAGKALSWYGEGEATIFQLEYA